MSVPESVLSMPTGGDARRGVDTLDDEAALTALGAGDAADAAAAASALADRYHAKLMNVLHRQYKYAPEVAGHAATAALMRLFDKSKRFPGTICAADHGVWRWLLKVAGDEARDYRRWVRRHGQDLLDPPADLPDEGGDGRFSRTEPGAIALGREEGRRILEFIMSMRDPERGILLNDLQGEYAELTGDALEVHDLELIDCSKAHGIWTRDALRSARTRARERLRAFIERGL